MKIFVDADGCPVVRLTVKIAKRYGIQCSLICDTAHFFDVDGAVTITVDKGADSADFRLANLIGKGDIAVTQDYGLAALCLSRGAAALNQNGMEYNDSNIASLLESRAAAKKIRRAGGRLKGPSKRTPRDDADFERKLTQMIESMTGNDETV